MASRTALLETIANRFLARREELAEEMTERIRAAEKKRRVRLNSLGGEVRNA
jgi:hypothetical protein